jgi:non-specific serine/threonine protein kinase/serine/threonine-protein kinase
VTPLARVREVYERAVDLSGSERDRVLAEACAGDDALRREVEALLRASTDAQSFLEHPPSAVDLNDLAAIAGADSGTFSRGDRFGAFTLVEPLGHGGMGVVYLAEQDHPRRTVALKLIRSPFLSPQLLKRFEQEAQVLALLRHPGIAQIYEAGSAPGPDGRLQPYYAMELVRGKPLIAFAERERLGTRERLQLFALVCDAVQHAHQKGVIHRDLKPGNILVEPGDALSTSFTGASFSGTSSTTSGPQPKVLDFGVARITGSDIAVTTVGTDVGQLVGTIPYMSPEQVRGDVKGIDTRSDVYALGVVLFELLTGRLPHDVKGKTIAAAAMTITNDEPTAPGRLSPVLRGDVETILLKALEKSPERRYQSAAELASDVRRHLADMPIIARPATAAYQFRKFARRNKALVGGVVAAFVLLVAGVVGTSVGLVRAKAAQKVAEQREADARIAARTAENSEQFLISMLTAANPLVSRNREMTVRELLDEAALKVDSQLAEEPAVALRTRLALGRTYLSINAVEPAQAQADAALTLATRHFGEKSVEASLAYSLAAGVKRAKSNPAGATEDFQRALAIRTTALPTGDPLIAKAQTELGNHLLRGGKFTEAEALLTEALATLEGANDPSATSCLITLASLQMRSRKATELDPCRAMLDAALERARAKGTAGQPQTAELLATLADLDRMQKRPADAIPRMREAIAIREAIYPPNHPTLLSTRLAYARTLRIAQKYDEALAVLDAITEPIMRTYGERSTMIGDLHMSRASMLLDQKRFEEAEGSARKYVDALSPNEQALQVIIAYSTLARCQEGREHWDDAAHTYQEAIDRAEGAKASVTSIATLRRSRASVVEKAGRIDEARAVLNEVLTSMGDAEQYALVRSEAHEMLGALEARAGRLALAAEHYRAAVAESESRDPAWSAEQYAALAEVLDKVPDASAAEAARAKATALKDAPKGTVSGQSAVPPATHSPH